MAAMLSRRIDLPITGGGFINGITDPSSWPRS